MATDISAVVVSYNNENEISRCIESLLGSGVEQISVVDNNSTDNTVHLVRRFNSVRLVENKENVGYGRAINQAVVSKTGWILVLNADTFVNQESLDSMAKVANSDSAISVVGPTIVDQNGNRYPTPRRFPSVVDAIGHAVFAGIWKSNPFTHRYQMNDVTAKSTGDVDWVSGACMLVNAKLFQNIGGFDERYFMYMEDVDLCKRFHSAGWRVVYEPSAEVVHIQGASSSQRRIRSIWSHHRSMLRYTATHLRGLDRLLLPIVWLGIVVRAVIQTVVSVAHFGASTD